MYNPYFQNQQQISTVPQYNQAPVVPPARMQQYADIYNGNPQQNMMKCRAVTSQEEARAAMIDLDGTVSVFTDFGNKKIYTKQINLDGTATLNTYTLDESNQPTQAAPEAKQPAAPEPQYYKPDLTGYVKEDELDDAFNQLNEQIYKLSQELDECKKAMANQAKAKSGAKK